ncbi:hypothetical protein MTO96_046014, partial [Rhipicephalus appendiculatus]
MDRPPRVTRPCIRRRGGPPPLLRTQARNWLAQDSFDASTRTHRRSRFAKGPQPCGGERMGSLVYGRDCLVTGTTLVLYGAVVGVAEEYVVQQQRRRRLGSGSDGSGSRRSSRDVDTLTDEDELLLELNGGDAPSSTTTATLIVSSSSTSSSQQQPPPPASGIVEEIVEENPFA